MDKDLKKILNDRGINVVSSNDFKTDELKKSQSFGKYVDDLLADKKTSHVEKVSLDVNTQGRPCCE